MTSVRFSVLVLLIIGGTVGLSLPAQAQSPIDINPNNSAGGGGAGSDPSALVNVDGTLFFSAEKDPNDSEEGWNLWKSDGTEAGTEKVKDIAPDNTNALVTPYAEIGGTLYLTAADGTHGIELWTSDGTAGGTQMVKDIFSGAGSGPNCNTGSLEFAVFNGELFFDAEDEHDDCEVWKSDGTANGTTLVANIRGGNSNPGSFTVASNTLYFKAYSGTTYGTEIYRVTNNGTDVTRVTDLASSPSKLTEAGGTLFFTANEGGLNTELYKLSGGTATRVKDIAGSDGSFPTSLTEVNGTLFFEAQDADGDGGKLWKSDGTSGGTQMVKDITDQFFGAQLRQFTAAGSTLYFKKDASGTSTAEIWKSDGTSSGTVMLASGLSSVSKIGHRGSTVFASVADGTHGEELWSSTGTSGTTQLVKDINTGSSCNSPPCGSLPRQFAEVGDTLFFVAENDTYGRELWVGNDRMEIVGSDGTGDADDIGWRLLAPPFSAVRGDLEDDLSFSVDSGNLMHTWDGTQWVPATTSSTSLARGEGFLLYFFDDSVDEITSSGFPLDVPISGDESQHANVTIDGLSKSDQFHLLGNPYDVEFDLAHLAGGDLPGKGFQSTVQIWDPTGSGQWTTITQGASNDNIAAWQGFFVERQSTGSGNTSLTFDASGRQSTSGDLIGSKSEGAAGQRAQVKLALSVEQGADTVAQDEVTLLLDDRAASGWDGYEATQLPPPNASTYATLTSPLMRDGSLVRRTLASAPYPTENTPITRPLSVRSVGTAGTATVQWPEGEREALPTGWTVELIDTVADSTVDLRTSAYSFSLNEGAGSLDDPDDARFGLRVTPATIPVEMTGLTARHTGEAVHLRWQTASETNNAEFQVQRRGAEAGWTTIGRVKGAGTTSQPQTYRFTDREVPYTADSLAYRLRQVDTDGTVHLSAVTRVHLAAPEELSLRTPFPNPARRQATLQFGTPAPTTVRISVYDLLGRRVATLLHERVQAGRHAASLSAAALAPGTYFVRLRADGTTRTKKFTVVR